MPCRYEIGSTTITDSIITPENHYRIIYFEAFDIVIARITDRFEQEGYQMYSKLEKLLRKLENDLDELIEFYGNDFEKDVLLAQLDNFHANYAFGQNVRCMILSRLLKLYLVRRSFYLKKLLSLLV